MATGYWLLATGLWLHLTAMILGHAVVVDRLPYS